MSSCDDLQMLMGEIQRGSIEAFDSFYEQLIGFVYQIALKTLKDKKEAEDICHDIFLEVYNRPFEYDASRGSIKAWLAVKTRSRCIDRLRRKRKVILEEPKKFGFSLSMFAQPNESTEEMVLSRVEKEVLQLAMQKIPEAQRLALQGKFFKAQTQNEIALEMSKPVGTVKSLIRYGIRNVRKQLNQLGWTGTSSRGGGSHEL